MINVEKIDHVAIIFNPGSSGDAPLLARKFKKELKTIGLDAQLTPTKHAGHAVDLARAAALTYKRPLIVSVSGDGGYNEVVNGAMQAKEHSKKAKPIVAVIGAGNANDHKRVMRSDASLLELIQRQKPEPFDLLLLEAKGANSIHRYAHSYIGLGLTSKAGDALNREGKGKLQEIKTIIRTFLRLKPVKIIHGNRRLKVDSLLFANINEMAKVATLSSKPQLQDGAFEVIITKHRHKLALLLEMAKFAAFRATPAKSTHSYTFTLQSKTSVQLDGEIEKIAKNTKITVTSEHLAIDSYFDYE